MPSAADDVAAAIAAAGAIPFAEYMRIALYGPNGFYTREGSAGRRGDFITSPEVGPLFGTVVAAAMDSWWDALGRPDQFDFIEVGAGPGTLARSILAAHPQCAAALRYTAIEYSSVQRTRHPADVTSLEEIPDGPITGVVFANELLDNVPFRLFVFDSGWREAFVGTAPDGTFVEVLRSIDHIPEALPKHAPHGTRLPVHDGAAAWVRNVLARIVHGRLVIVDYCTSHTAELVSMPWRQWLRTYRQQERGTHYLRDVGMQDITTQVCLDQLPASDLVFNQASFLRQHGIEAFVEEGRMYWHEHASAPDLAAMKMRSRIVEAEALLEPTGLGAFSVVEWRVPGP